MRYLFTTLLILLSTAAFAQTGTISGKIINEKNGDVLSGASVNVSGNSRKTSSDQAGQFTIKNLAPGTYTITVSYVGFSTKEISDILVRNGEVTDISVSLAVKANTLQDVVVRSQVSRENQSALLITQKNATVVSDGISAELIRKTPDRNTSDVLKRVSGVSIQENKFAVVRGLNDRYNAAYLNGAPLPSTENDRKAFAFDIFPANMLENLVIIKTASPDLPGEFAGGIINITTSSIPAKNFTSISLGTGYNTLATFKEGFTYKGGKSDWLGIDDGTRALPSGIPAPAQYPVAADSRAQLAKLYTKNNWGLISGKMAPNLSFQLSKGLNISRKGNDFLGMLFSLTYNKSNSISNGELNSYEYNRANPAEPPIQRAQYNHVNTYSEATLAGLVANFSMKLNANNRISFKNLVSINAEDRVITLDGQPDVPGDPEFRVNGRGLWFTSNIIGSSQLYGEHNFSAAKMKLNWLMGYSEVKRDIPNLRQMYYSYNVNDNIYTAGIVSSTISADNSGSMLTSKTNEKIYSGKLDISKTFLELSDFKTTVKAGGYYQYRDRGFDARLLGFATYRGTRGFDYSLLNQPQESIFAPENMGTLASGKGGFQLLDGTNPTYSYTASSALGAGYIMGDSRFGKKVRAVYGVRYEQFNQKLNSYLDFTNPINLNTSKGDLLPSLNLVYSADSKQNLRFSYSKTLNRPEFRELAPFAFFDFSNRIVVGGNPTLQRATIQNYDVRYEMYPGKGQLISLSAFYKNFANPIELTSDPNNFSSTAYQNAKDAQNYGFEVELRTQLNTIFAKNSSILERFTASANASYIVSRVQENPFAGVVKSVENRPLQGQSPYLVNAALSYSDSKNGWSANLSANRVGQRIFIVGSVNEPDTWEHARTILDFQLSKTLLRNKLEFKLNCRDLLRQNQVFFLDQNENRKYDKGTDKVFNLHTFGSVISLTASYKF